MKTRFFSFASCFAALLCALFCVRPALAQAPTPKPFPVADVFFDKGDADYDLVKNAATSQSKSTPFYKSNGLETRTYEGFFKPNSSSSKLALLSDDGTSVWIDDSQIMNRAGKGQGFENFDNTFSALSYSFTAGHVYHLRLVYTNTVHRNDADVDGLTLFAYDGGGEIVDGALELNVESSREALVAGGVRVGNYYSSVNVNPHQSQVTATVTRGDSNIADQEVTFDLTSSKEQGGDAGFAERDGQEIKSQIKVKTDSAGVARTVLTSGTRTGSINVRVSVGKTATEKTFSVEEAQGKWSTTAVGEDQNGDPILRLTLKHGGLPVNGHPISWKITQVTLSSGKVIGVSRWNEFARLNGISSNGEAVSTTGAHGKPGEAAAYISLSFFLRKVLYSAVDTVIQEPAPNSVMAAGRAASPPPFGVQSISASATQEHKEGALIKNGNVQMGKPVIHGGVVKGQSPLDFNTLTGNTEDDQVLLGSRNKADLQFPVALDGSIRMEFNFSVEGNPQLASMEMSGAFADLGAAPGLWKRGTMRRFGPACAPSSEDAWASSLYFLKFFGPELVKASIKDMYNLEMTRPKRIVVTLTYGLVGFVKGGTDTVEMVLNAPETVNSLKVTIDGLTGPKRESIKKALIAEIRQSMETEYDALYDDAVRGKGYKVSALAGTTGGYIYFNAWSGVAIGRAGTTISKLPLVNKTINIGTYGVRATLTNAGRIAKVPVLMTRYGLKSMRAPALKLLGNGAKWTLKGKTSAQFAVSALKNQGARIAFYAQGKGYVIGVKSDKILGYITQNGVKIPCRYANIVAQVDKAGKVLGIKSIQLMKSLVCFTKGTPILMANGTYRAIEQIKVGDLVMSRDEATGQTSAQRVTQTFEKQAAATLVLRLKNGETIETTKEHPFYVESQGFTAAGEMGIGTAIVTRAGPSAILASSQVRDRKATVYNFEVENTHT